jgi:hypothetical protein
MNCPYCEFAGGWNALHLHLFEQHSDRVHTEEAGDRLVYVVTCPICSLAYRKPIKKSAADPDFVVEFERQIRLVALDMLMTHLLAEHDGEEPAVESAVPRQDQG